jgi:hypothetical protein
MFTPENFPDAELDRVSLLQGIIRDANPQRLEHIIGLVTPDNFPYAASRGDIFQAIVERTKSEQPELLDRIIDLVTPENFPEAEGEEERAFLLQAIIRNANSQQLDHIIDLVTPENFPTTHHRRSLLGAIIKHPNSQQLDRIVGLVTPDNFPDAADRKELFGYIARELLNRAIPENAPAAHSRTWRPSSSLTPTGTGFEPGDGSAVHSPLNLSDAYYSQPGHTQGQSSSNYPHHR